MVKKSIFVKNRFSYMVYMKKVDMSTQTIQNINDKFSTFFIQNACHGASLLDEAPFGELYESLGLSVEECEKFDKVVSAFVKVFGPVIDSLGMEIDDEEGRKNSDRAINAIWRGDRQTQRNVRSILNKKGPVKDKVSKPKKVVKKEFDHAKAIKKVHNSLRKYFIAAKKKSREEAKTRALFKKFTKEIAKKAREIAKKAKTAAVEEKKRTRMRKKICIAIRKHFSAINKKKKVEKKAGEPVTATIIIEDDTEDIITNQKIVAEKIAKAKADEENELAEKVKKATPTIMTSPTPFKINNKPSNGVEMGFGYTSDGEDDSDTDTDSDSDGDAQFNDFMKSKFEN